MKLNIKGERDKQLRYAFIGLSALTFILGVGNVLTGSLAWYFATTQKTITTPLTFNRPFASDSKVRRNRPDTVRRFLYLLATERHPGKHRQ
jgi:conjugal transfer pilus assembly protein TraE